jgi:nicotinamidase/pyrazinamidase
MASIFTKIIRGEIPSYRVYEDEATFAFLDINPRHPGHTLVVPKREVDELFDLPAEDYEALWAAVRTVGTALKAATGTDRVFVSVVGIDVPHAHVHVIPSHPDLLPDFPFPPVVEQSQEQLTAMATSIAEAVAASPFDERTALVVVDVQNDFAHPEGSLSVAGGTDVIPVVNAAIGQARSAGATVVYTQDWHPPSTPHFEKDGGTWPVHCVADTWGAEFHAGLDVIEDAVFTRKGTGGEDGYSGFSMREPGGNGQPTSTGLEEALRERGIERVVIVGLATDYCVKETSLDAVRLGFQAVALNDAMRAVDLDPGDGSRALAEMRAAGVEVR